LAPPPRSHPPPLYYLPAILTPAQEEFIKQRKAEVSPAISWESLPSTITICDQVQEAVDKEWSAFCTERTVGIEEITQLRQRVLEAEERKKAERAAEADAEAETAALPAADAAIETRDPEHDVEMHIEPEDASREDKDGNGDAADHNRKDEPAPMQADDDDAVEY
jgi:tyrosyl-tRNA synthetase